MRPMLHNNPSDEDISDESLCQADGGDGHSFFDTMGLSGEVSWPERRKTARSFAYRSDWKVATVLYLALIIFIVMMNYL